MRGTRLTFASITLPTLASAALRLGLAAELATALESHVPTPWSEVVRSYAADDFVAAADKLEAIGSKPEEAEARMHAAKQLAASGRGVEANEQLQHAIAFYRSVGATRYLQECGVRSWPPRSSRRRFTRCPRPVDLRRKFPLLALLPSPDTPSGAPATMSVSPANGPK